MNSESEELHLMKLKQFIYDEDKIVTAVWLGKECNINIQSAHTLLTQFIEDQKSSKGAENTLGISYTLVGTSKEADKQCIMIVKHDQLAEKKKLFNKITSEQVYSIQKATDVNFNTIGLVDMLELHGAKGTLLGCAVSKNCVLRKNLPNKKVLPAVTRAAGTDKSKASHLFASTTSSKPREITKPASAPEVGKKEDVKSEPKGKLAKQNSGDKKNSIANMFAKAPPAKEKPLKNEPEPEPRKAPVEAINIDDEDTDVEAVVEVDKKVATRATNGKKNDLYDSGTDEEAHKIEAANKAKVIKDEGTASTKKRASRSKRHRDDKSVERPQKKRKRIVQHIESDEDIFADDDDETEEAHASLIPSEDDEPTTKNNTQSKTLAAKNRKRKFVEKTYEDEEGYIVTKKEMISESGESDEEEKENPPKKPAPKKASPKVVKEISPTNKKGSKKKQAVKPANQPTLMNFFKKK